MSSRVKIVKQCLCINLPCSCNFCLFILNWCAITISKPYNIVKCWNSGFLEKCAHFMKCGCVKAKYKQNTFRVSETNDTTLTEGKFLRGLETSIEVLQNNISKHSE